MSLFKNKCYSDSKQSRSLGKKKWERERRRERGVLFSPTPTLHPRRQGASQTLFSPIDAAAASLLRRPPSPSPPALLLSPPRPPNYRPHAASQTRSPGGLSQLRKRLRGIARAQEEDQGRCCFACYEESSGREEQEVPGRGRPQGPRPWLDQARRLRYLQVSTRGRGWERKGERRRLFREQGRNWLERVGASETEQSTNSLFSLTPTLNASNFPPRQPQDLRLPRVLGQDRRL